MKLLRIDKRIVDGADAAAARALRKRLHKLACNVLVRVPELRG